MPLIACETGDVLVAGSSGSSVSCISASEVIRSIAFRSTIWFLRASISPRFSSCARTRRGDVSCCIEIMRISRSISSGDASRSWSSAMRSRIKCSLRDRSVVPSIFCCNWLICRRISSSGKPAAWSSRIERCNSRCAWRRSNCGGSSQAASAVSCSVICRRTRCCWW